MRIARHVLIALFFVLAVAGRAVVAAETTTTDSTSDEQILQRSAIQLGFSLYHKYGNKFSLTQFRDEVVAWKGLQVRMTAPK